MDITDSHHSSNGDKVLALPPFSALRLISRPSVFSSPRPEQYESGWPAQLIENDLKTGAISNLFLLQVCSPTEMDFFSPLNKALSKDPHFQACNPSIWEAEAGGWNLGPARLGYAARQFLRKQQEAYTRRLAG